MSYLFDRSKLKHDLRNVQVGDTVAVLTRAVWSKPSSKIRLFVVERITTTQLVCKGGARFKKKGGLLIGSLHSEHGFIPTAEQIEADRIYREQYNREYSAREWLRDTVFNRHKELTVTQIEAMKAAYESATEEVKE